MGGWEVAGPGGGGPGRMLAGRVGVTIGRFSLHLGAFSFCCIQKKKRRTHLTASFRRFWLFKAMQCAQKLCYGECAICNSRKD